jgi:ABC-type lipoprotein export system ATPase subunit
MSNRFPSRETVERIRAQYPVGCRVELIKMDDIARSIINKPRYILADEPTGALDSVTSKQVMNVFCQLNRTGTGIIIATHDMNVAHMCSRIIYINDGKLIEN